MCIQNLKFVALPVPEIIVIGVLVGVVTPNLVEEEASGMVPFERTLLTSSMPFIVTFPISSRLSEILPLLCSSTPLFPTPTKTPITIISGTGKATNFKFGLSYEEGRCQLRSADWRTCVVRQTYSNFELSLLPPWD